MQTISYPAHGWLPKGAKFSWQRSDQGRDFVTNWKGIIQAPGDGICVNVGADRPFPNGFGPHYPWVKITSGAFRGHTFYLGHCSSLVSVGEHFGFGHSLAKSDQGKPSQIGVAVPGDGGWVELGQVQPNGVLGPYSNAGHWFDVLLRQPLAVKIPDKPLKFGDWGWHVWRMTAWLTDCGWLPHAQLRFNTRVKIAVIGFKHYHHLPMAGADEYRSIVGERPLAAIALASAHCNKTRHKEH